MLFFSISVMLPRGIRSQNCRRLWRALLQARCSVSVMKAGHVLSPRPMVHKLEKRSSNVVRGAFVLSTKQTNFKLPVLDKVMGISKVTSR